jgi:hypothetical protein
MTYTMKMGHESKSLEPASHGCVGNRVLVGAPYRTVFIHFTLKSGLIRARRLSSLDVRTPTATGVQLVDWLGTVGARLLGVVFEPHLYLTECLSYIIKGEFRVVVFAMTIGTTHFTLSELFCYPFHCRVGQPAHVKAAILSIGVRVMEL